MTYKAVVFDLDGTLLDTLADIAGSANRVLADQGYPAHPEHAYRLFVGDGSRVLMTRALPQDKRQPQFIDACLNAFIADYQLNWDKATRPYDGIADLVESLEKKGVQMAVVTNKPHRFTTVMMDHYFQNSPFYPILGQQNHIPKKPHPHQAMVAADKMGVDPTACIFLGDSAVDIQTAIRAGMHPVGAGWGFRSYGELTAAGAKAVLHHPMELLDIL